ncbi:MAG: hypothetical protein ACM32J_13575, partial [Rhizobacter sp.]
TGLPPASAAAEGSLDILSLPPELGHLINLFGRWGERPADAEQAPTLSEAVLGRRFAHAAYRMQLMPLLGDAQAATLKSQTGDLARAPWQLSLTPTLLKTQDHEVAVISEGHFRPRVPTESEPRSE